MMSFQKRTKKPLACYLAVVWEEASPTACDSSVRFGEEKTLSSGTESRAPSCPSSQVMWYMSKDHKITPIKPQSE